MTSLFRRHPAGFLLAAQLLGLIVYPLTTDTLAGRAVFELFGMVVLTLTIVAVKPAPTPTAPSIALAIVASGFSIATIFAPGVSWLVGVSAIAHALFYFLAAVGLVWYMIRDFEVTLDELLGIGATFTLLAWGFAYIFQLLQVIQPGSFSRGAEGGVQSWTNLLFLSSTNLSGTGLSDIVPALPLARGFVVIEQIVGLATVAVLTGYLVGLTMSRVTHRKNDRSRDNSE